MKNVLFWELMWFALKRTPAKERLRYLLLAILFYPLLVRENRTGEKNNESAASSQAGDDIYPLF
jgi:hypothetical protein